jgi:uncharacterized protein involved in exopolysaccharide biosynthesis
MVNEYTLSDFIRMILKRRKHFMIILVTSLVVATLFSLIMPNVYQAELTMYAPTSTDVMSFGGGRQGTQLRPLLPSVNELLSGAILGLLKSETMEEMVLSALGEEKRGKWKYIIDYSEDYGHFTVTANARNNEKAAEIANIIPSVANKLVVEVSGSSLINNIAYIKAQLDTASVELEETRAELSEFRREHYHIVLGQQSAMTIAKNAEYQTEYDRLGVDLALIGATIDELTTQMAKEAQLYVEEEAVAQSPTIQQLRTALTEKEMRMAAMKTQYTEYHPTVIALGKEIEENKEMIRREVDHLFSSQTKPSNTFFETLRQNAVQKVVDFTATQARRDALSTLIEKTDQILLSLPALQNELATLTFNEKVKEGVYQNLVARLTELELQLGREFQSFVVLEKAKVPRAPSFPILWLNGLLALLFGFFGGIVYCILLEYFERAKIVRYADSAMR